MPTPLSSRPAHTHAAPPSGLSGREALRTVARGLMGGLMGLVIDALLPDRTGSGPHRLH